MHHAPQRYPASRALLQYPGERGKVGTRQPNYGLDRLFGARESYVEFTPDLLDNLSLEVAGKQVGGRFFLQQYEAAGGTIIGRYKDGNAAAIEHRAGKGRVLLIGTFPGAAYFLHHSQDTRAFFAGLLDWAGVKQIARVNDPQLKARVHSGAGGTYLWVVNPTRTPRTVTVTLDARIGPFSAARDLWQSEKANINGQTVSVTVEDRNVGVVKLEP